MIKMEAKKTRINWKVRFKNKIWLMSFISLIIGFVYNILRLFDIIPVTSQEVITDIAGQVLTFLGLIGMIQDPTTAGLGDSDRAMQYDEPWEDKPSDDQDQGPTE